MITIKKTAVFVVMLSSLWFLCGCGGGGGRSAASSSGSGMSVSPPPWYPPPLEERVRTTAEFNNVTYYMPSLGKWNLFSATAQYVWISAIGTGPGVSASMSNPFNKVGVLLLPKSMYNNPGHIAFFVDGKPAGTLDLSADVPFEGYQKDFVSYYEIASGLDDTMIHTVSIVIASGTVGIDGWRMKYQDSTYDIDCSEVNTLEEDTLTGVETLRDEIEEYAQTHSGAYPEPASGTSLVAFLNATRTISITPPTNPFNHRQMKDSALFSAGDYSYEIDKTSSDGYKLIAYGGAAPVIEYTHNSVDILEMKLKLKEPAKDHYTTASPTVIFEGTTELLISPQWASPSLKFSGVKNSPYYSDAPAVFSDTVTLNDGVNHIKVIYSYPHGKTVSLMRIITLDTTAPDINIIEPFPMHGPLDNLYAYCDASGAATVTAFVGLDSTAFINNAPINPDSKGLITSSLKIPAGETKLIVTIRALDPYNNVNAKSFAIQYR